MLFISLDSILVPCVVCVSVPFTELHEHAHTVLVLLWYECVLFTNNIWEFNLLYSVALPSFVHVSLSISELHQCAYSHCFLLWYEEYCLPTSYLNIGVISLNPIYLFTKFHASKHSGKTVTQTSMPYFGQLFFCGFPKSKVFTQTLICLFPARHQTLYLYQVSYYVGVFQLVRFVNSTRR